MSRIEVLLPMIGKLNYCWTNTESLLIYLIVYLMQCSKEAAIIVFLTLNTTRARLDLVERLAKMSATAASDRTAVLDLTARLKLEGKIRNKYNHSIFDFDENGELESTQLMRIAEFGDEIKYGKLEEVDNLEIEKLAKTIDSIVVINQELWRFIRVAGIKKI